MDLFHKAAGFFPLVAFPADGSLIEILPPLFFNRNAAFFLQPCQKGQDGGCLPLDAIP